MHSQVVSGNVVLSAELCGDGDVNDLCTPELSLILPYIHQSGGLFYFPQDWQLKLSGIDITGDGETEETDLGNDSPRSPIGAVNPLLLGNPKGEFW